MNRLTRIFLALIATTLIIPAPAPAQAPADPAIKAMMLKSVDDWNRHDIDAFATSYKNSPDILFIGHRVSHGYDQMVATYKSVYGTPEKMGMLSFSVLETQPLDANFATVTGHFHLERTAAGGGNADGYFLPGRRAHPLRLENRPRRQHLAPAAYPKALTTPLHPSHTGSP